VSLLSVELKDLKVKGDWFNMEVLIHEAELRQYLKHRAPSNIQIDDILQEAYAKIVKKSESMDIDNPKSLLFRIAKDINIDYIRKKYRRKTISIGGLNELDGYEVVDSSINKPESDELILLKKAVESLPNKCKRIFLLRHFEDVSRQEIATKLGISPKTVDAQLAVGVKKCHLFLQKYNLTVPQT
jgi:RNA polymerase sigma factor (sigma-70 family)